MTTDPARGRPGPATGADPGPDHADPFAWLDELDLDPTSPWLRMGVRSLGDRPWLVVDHLRDDELALKASLLATEGRAVFDALPGAEAAGAEVSDLVRRELETMGASPDPAPTGLHPLDAAGRLVQDDLCLLRRRDDRWHLDAASLCFPSRWSLQDKLGRPMLDVHGPVAGYADALAGPVDRLFDRLSERPVWRRNWFVHADPALHQPRPPADGDPLVPAEHVEHDLHVRSERQTLRRLPSGWVLFTIRIQHCPLGRLLADPDRRAAFGRYLEGADEADLAHRGMNPAQASELRRELSRTAS